MLLRTWRLQQVLDLVQYGAVESIISASIESRSLKLDSAVRASQGFAEGGSRFFGCQLPSQLYFIAARHGQTLWEDLPPALPGDTVTRSLLVEPQELELFLVNVGPRRPLQQPGVAAPPLQNLQCPREEKATDSGAQLSCHVSSNT